METKKQKIARHERLKKHYCESLWEAEKAGRWDEAQKIKHVLAELETVYCKAHRKSSLIQMDKKSFDKILVLRDNEIAELIQQLDTMRRIADRNHKANMMPCPKCGYQPNIIHSTKSADANGTGGKT